MKASTTRTGLMIVRGEHAADATADRDLGAVDLGGGDPADLAHLSCSARTPCVGECILGNAAAIPVEGQLAAGGRYRVSRFKARSLPRGTKPSLGTEDRQTRGGAADQFKWSEAYQNACLPCA